MDASSTTAIATSPLPAGDSNLDSSLSRVSKVIAQLKERVAKLAADNKKLKEQLASARSSTSRIRRIPKPKETTTTDA